MARFFELTYPEYEDDFAFARMNPIWIDEPFSIPSMICEKCGVRGGSGRIRIPLPEETALEEFREGRFLPREEWLRERLTWAKLLGVDSTRITPAASIGPPVGLLKGTPTADLIYPSGRIWVQPHIMTKLKEARCTGIEFAKATLVYRATDPESFCDGVAIDPEPIDLTRVPDYWELVVTGKAWREGHDESTSLACDLCGRRKFPSPESMKVDESRWDGGDFFNVDGNTSIVLVTERVCNALSELSAANYFCKPLD
jgi:hypothetical protein